MDLRSTILQLSLSLEETASKVIAGLLDIRNYEESLCFGSKSSSLSFNQKIGLLMDLGALNPKLKSKYRIFMEVRNKFMHVAEINSFEKCINVVDGLKSTLDKYPRKEERKPEQQYLYSFNQMFLEIEGHARHVYYIISDKKLEQARQDFTIDAQTGLKNALPHFAIILTNYFRKERGFSSVADEKINSISNEIIELFSVCFQEHLYDSGV